jgi:hypothetical protein
VSKRKSKRHQGAQQRREAQHTTKAPNVATASRVARLRPPVPDDHPTLYVAYGSNHNVVQMQARCPDAMPVLAGIMPDTRLVFSNVATVEPQQGARCPVSVWRVSRRDIAALDRYEGWPWTYGKRYTHVTVDGERCRAFYYVLRKPYTESPPSAYYYRCLQEGYEDWDLPQKYLREARLHAMRVAWHGQQTALEPMDEQEYLEALAYGTDEEDAR